MGVSLMRLRIPILALGFVSLATVCAMIWARAPRDPSPALSVSLLAYSNSASGLRFAILAVTNDDVVDITIDDTGAVEFNNTNFCRRVWSSPAGTNLHRGDACRVVVEVPAHRARWRTSWWITRQTLKERLTWRIKRYRDYQLGMQVYRKRFWHDWFDSYYGENCCSDWMPE